MMTDHIASLDSIDLVQNEVENEKERNNYDHSVELDFQYDLQSPSDQTLTESKCNYSDPLGDIDNSDIHEENLPSMEIVKEKKIEINESEKDHQLQESVIETSKESGEISLESPPPKTSVVYSNEKINEEDFQHYQENLQDIDENVDINSAEDSNEDKVDDANEDEGNDYISESDEEDFSDDDSLSSSRSSSYYSNESLSPIVSCDEKEDGVSNHSSEEKVEVSASSRFQLSKALNFISSSKQKATNYVAAKGEKKKMPCRSSDETVPCSTVEPLENEKSLQSVPASSKIRQAYGFMSSAAKSCKKAVSEYAEAAKQRIDKHEEEKLNQNHLSKKQAIFAKIPSFNRAASKSVCSVNREINETLPSPHTSKSVGHESEEVKPVGRFQVISKFRPYFSKKNETKEIIPST